MKTLKNKTPSLLRHALFTIPIKMANIAESKDSTDVHNVAISTVCILMVMVMRMVVVVMVVEFLCSVTNFLDNDSK